MASLSHRLTESAPIAKHSPVFAHDSLRALALAALCALVGCGTASAESRPRARVDRPGLPLLGATDAELKQFRDGDALFETTVRESDGLGPLYVRDACAACHQGDGRGPGFVNKFITSETSSAERTPFPFGTSERPFVAAGATQALLLPTGAGFRSVRRLPPAVFGRGYIEAIRVSELERVAKTAESRTGVVRGRANRLKNGAMGRFGLKARIATLEDFTADALNGDMGMTTPQRPDEPRGPEGLLDDARPGIDFDASRVARLSEYVRLLEIPTRQPDTAGGAELFARVGCATCHVPSLRTETDYPVAALADIDAPVYSDLLLHDMGESRSDGQREERALPSEFRTAPLIGLRFLPTLLHDGGARTVADAIELHAVPGSEGREAAQAYRALTAEERSRLLKFVESL